MRRSRKPGFGNATRRATALWFTPLAVVALAAAVVLLGAAPSYAAKPAPKLTSTLCATLGGTWAGTTCTIDTPATASSSFTVPAGYSLFVGGTAVDSQECVFSIASGVTITVSAGGTFTIANPTILVGEYGNGYGVCNSGTIANLGTLDIQNGGDGSTGLLNIGAVTNAGAITIANSGEYSWGITNAFQPADGGGVLATLANTGTITISNGGTASMGLCNYGTVTNSGTLTVESSLGTDAVGFYQDGGTFTNEAAGTLTNNYGAGDDPSSYLATNGFYNNGGTMINFGTANNSGNMLTRGWVMLTYGTFNNYGTLYQASGELVNYGTVHNFGTIGVSSYSPDYPHNRGICINESVNGVTGTGCQ